MTFWKQYIVLYGGFHDTGVKSTRLCIPHPHLRRLISFRFLLSLSELPLRLVDLRYGNIQVEGSGAEGDRQNSWVRVSL